MRIGELAARTGVSVRALRYYEEQSLLVAERSRSGQRHYPDGAVDRVRLIQQLYAAGLSSRTITELLPCVVDGRATPALLERLAAEREHVDRRITDLTQVRDRLDSVIAAATGSMLTGASCRASARPDPRGTG
ncbi:MULTISPECIES: MerR family transcriptional regulator [unclassified Streptomyces]|uniref:MerR family transcriptional regulator n=1 Tax=unclassified Streptomyces TaxID=2593676 RepID=UPI00099828CD|nr:MULTISPECIES: MerR family transcriptional regulator [unclassified Streptomyces]MYX27606.1 MerR family transcriptional regulator [Streptomyces sp. SID8381]